MKYKGIIIARKVVCKRVLTDEESNDTDTVFKMCTEISRKYPDCNVELKLVAESDGGGDDEEE